MDLRRVGAALDGPPDLHALAVQPDRRSDHDFIVEPIQQAPELPWPYSGTPRRGTRYLKYAVMSR